MLRPRVGLVGLKTNKTAKPKSSGPEHLTKDEAAHWGTVRVSMWFRFRV